MEKKALEMLEGNLNRLGALAAALMEHETLGRREIDTVMKEEASTISRRPSLDEGFRARSRNERGETVAAGHEPEDRR